MHALKPNTQYKIVSVQLALPASLDDAEITDGLNELLRSVCAEDFIADWAFKDTKPSAKWPHPTDYLMLQTGPIAEEGCLFSSIWRREQRKR